MPNFIEHSKTNWTSKNPDVYPGDAEVQIGCLQRIANSLENMEEPYLKLIRDAENYKRWYLNERDSNRKMARRIAALQGVITKMKKKGN